MAPVAPDISMISPWPGPPLSQLLRPCDRPIVFAGAGVSAGCGLPTGERLAAWLRAQDFAANVDFSNLDAGSRGSHPGFVASRILDSGGVSRPVVLAAVAAHIDTAQAGAMQSRVVNAIASTPAGVVLTLNYDTLIEKAAHAQGRKAHSLGLADVPELINDHLLEPDGELRVVHLHGKTKDPDSLVIDHRSYMEQANDGKVRELLAALVAGHNLCAIGTKFEEDYLAAVMLARRPTRPRHVFVCDVELAERVMNGGAGIDAERHNWLPCAYPVGEYGVLDGFCERLVSCDEAPPTDGPRIPVGPVSLEPNYASRRLIDREEIERESELSVELQLQFGQLSAYNERVLEREQLAVVIGPPGSGKTRLLQEAADSRAADRAIFLRLRDVDDIVGKPDLLLSSWLEQATAFSGEPIPVEDVVAGRVRAWLLLDGLDEVTLERRAETAKSVERLAQAYPQHRFTVSSRPVAALADLSPLWRAFHLVCDEEWQGKYLRANDVDEERFWRALGPAGLRLKPLLSMPFFLGGALRQVEAGEEVGGALEISLKLLDRSLEADEQLKAVGSHARGWLTRVALLQQLSGTVSVEESDLRELSEAEGLGDPRVLTDLLAGRSLLAESGGRWAFAHRLFGEALAAEHLLGQDPAAWLDCVAPEVAGWSAVLDHWAPTLRMVLARSQGWRREIARRDPRFAALATPVEAAAGERLAAARMLWRRAVELDVWLDPVDRDVEATDSEVVADLIRAGGLDDLVGEVRSALAASSSFVRGSAVELLAAVPVVGIEGILERTLADDEASVVRRIAAIEAGRLGLDGLAEPIARRAQSPADALEAMEMARAAIALLPPERKLPLARTLLEAGSGATEHIAMGDAPLDDRFEWLELVAGAEGERSLTLGSEVSRLAAEVAASGEEELVERMGYLAALSGSHDADLLAFLGAHPAAARGVLRALDDEEISSWEARPLLEAAGAEAPSKAQGDEEGIAGLAVAGAVGRRMPAADRSAGSQAERGLAAALELPLAERRAELARLALADRGHTVELTPAARHALSQALSDWWGNRDLRMAVHVEGRGAQIEHWATVVLVFGPAAELELDDARWLQVATCGWLFEAQRKWIAAQVTQPRLESAAEAATGVAVLTDLLEVGVGFEVAPICERLASVSLAEPDALDLARAGKAVFAVEGRMGLERLAAAGEEWATALRPQLASAGVFEAQLAELEDLVQRLLAGERVDRFELSWLTNVSDRRALPVLERALIAIGGRAVEEPGADAPVLRAIESSGGIEAVALLDRLAREPAYPGAQFLIAERDRVLQPLLGPAASEAAREMGGALHLPVRAPMAPPRLLGQFGQRLREALEGMAFRRPATAIGISLRLEPVRGSGTAAPAAAPVRVELGEEGATVLGNEARARALVGGGRIVLWLSGLATIAPGTLVRATAIGPDGAPVNTDAQVAVAAGSVQLELPWDADQLPGMFALTVAPPA